MLDVISSISGAQSATLGIGLLNMPTASLLRGKTPLMNVRKLSDGEAPGLELEECGVLLHGRLLPGSPRLGLVVPVSVSSISKIVIVS